MRKLTPELLDSLPHDDAGAQRSRKDLRRINFFMGNERWILSKLSSSERSITEIGAGDGHLFYRLTKRFPAAALKAYDLTPRPSNIVDSAEWIQGDLFSQPSPEGGGVLIANLFLHHFTDIQLITLGSWMQHFDSILICEPWRALLPQVMAKCAYPLIHPITRHDMRVSIEAGFVAGEIGQALGLEKYGFDLTETIDWRGSIRLTCVKRNNLS